MKTTNEIKQLAPDSETAKTEEVLKKVLAAEPGNLQAKMLYGRSFE